MSPLETGITVHDIWRLALPPGTELAGGKEGIYQTVEWVASLRAAFPLFGDLSEGYIAVAHPELARSLDPRLTLGYLIAELDRAKGIM